MSIWGVAILAVTAFGSWLIWNKREQYPLWLATVVFVLSLLIWQGEIGKLGFATAASIIGNMVCWFAWAVFHEERKSAQSKPNSTPAVTEPAVQVLPTIEIPENFADAVEVFGKLCEMFHSLEHNSSVSSSMQAFISVNGYDSLKDKAKVCFHLFADRRVDFWLDFFHVRLGQGFSPHSSESEMLQYNGTITGVSFYPEFTQCVEGWFIRTCPGARVVSSEQCSIKGIERIHIAFRFD